MEWYEAGALLLGCVVAGMALGFPVAFTFLLANVLGMFVFFSDYFSPLFVGTTMRSLSDKARISREKLAYIADSTSAPVSVLVPITGWAVYIAGLLIGMGPILDASDAMSVFTQAIPYNFYALLSVLMA